MDINALKMSSRFSSSTSSLPNECLSEEEKSVWNFAKSMLLGRLFMGTFQEKRYVEKLTSYRDVIVVHNSETDLIKDMARVRNRLVKYYKNNVWIGITTSEMIGTPAGNCFWVELSDEVFGGYWYKIKSVRFRRNEILLKLKEIRPITNETKKVVSQAPKFENFTQNDISQTLEYSVESVKNNILHCFVYMVTILTFHNLKEAIKFFSVLIVTMITGLFQFSSFLSEFLLKVFRETNRFIYVSTPVALAVINLVGKVIGGFYLLLAMMWRDWRHPQQKNLNVRPSTQMLSIDSNNERKIQYPPWQTQRKY